MVRIDIRYEGDLHCACTHEPSGSELTTDAPLDNQGRGESFSPTDLVATALGSCVATTMGIVAARHEVDLRGMRVTVVKHMASEPTRRIGKLVTVLHIPGEVSTDDRRRLEAAARHCPVHASLAPEVDAPITFRWGVA